MPDVEKILNRADFTAGSDHKNRLRKKLFHNDNNDTVSEMPLSVSGGGSDKVAGKNRISIDDLDMVAGGISDHTNNKKNIDIE